jgi:polar amino acid transport system substrate-binding protein
MAKWLAPLALAGMLACAAQASSSTREIVISNSEGGSLLGFLGHVLDAAYGRVGAKPVIKSYPAARSIEMANDGATDAEALRGPGLDRDFPNLIRVPEPILTLEYRAYTLKTPFTGESWESLRGKRVCVNLGEKVIEERTRDMPRELAHGTDAALKMLKAGRCDLVLSNQFAWLVMDRYDLGTFCSGTALIEAIPLYHYVNKRRADLVPGLAAALRSMRESGQLDRYLAADPDQALLAQARARHECKQAPTGAVPR